MRWQIISPQAEQVSSFYCSLFGWEANRDNPLGYQAIDTKVDKGIQGGIWPAPPDAPSFVQLFVEVDDCAAFVHSAVDKGATVVVPPQVLPGGETMAVLRDPAGMSFGIMSVSGG
jgi:predicted enzyme related to lactoylglutathione lyase